MLEYILWIVEHLKTSIFITFSFFYFQNYSLIDASLKLVVSIIGSLFLLIVYLIYNSWRNVPSQQFIDWTEYFESNKLNNYKGKRVPISLFVDYYLNGDITLKKNMLEIMQYRYGFFHFKLDLYYLKFFLTTFIQQLMGHDVNSDRSEIVPVYNQGNDFYSWFLGTPMIYTSGIYENEEQTLEQAQNNKLEYIAKKTLIQREKVKNHLDIGCGWGTLCRYFSKNYNVNSTGIAIASEQIEWCKEKAKEENNEAKFECIDYRDLSKVKKYDIITCLEMAEHVGIKNYQEFLKQVYNILEDDGVLYFQVAGLRRQWKFEDLCWGLFMGRYIFPAADASCPIGWVSSQLERAGYEVMEVKNMGVHYNKTITHWYENWEKSKEKVLEKYGEWWYRLWILFLGWSQAIAAQGSSTVFMITCTKNLETDKKSDILGGILNRTELNIPPKKKTI